MRPLSELKGLPRGLREAVAAMEAKTTHRWGDVTRQKFAVAIWSLHNLAGEMYQVREDLSPWWVPFDGPTRLLFWKLHYQWWTDQVATSERTQALKLCINGLREEARYV